MGSYCDLYIADYPIFSSKSYVLPVVMTLFRETDKAVYDRKVIDRNPIEWDHIEAEANEIETVVNYRAPIKHVRDRLNVLGFTLDRVRQEFNNARVAEAQKLREWSAEDDNHLWDDDISVLESNSLEDYLEAFQTILSSGVHTVHFLERFPESPQLIKYILNGNEEFHWGFPCLDIRSFFRAIVEIAPEDSFVVEDLTEVVNAGYYNKEDEVCILALQELLSDYPINSKIIIITEGSTDTQILQPSLKLLYPHLFDYYSFMDFGVKPPGGVGPLVNAVKSFAGAGIENRIIALFDNDTAAFSAIESLKYIDIPNNIIIKHYPDIELSKDYPALGPNGLVKQDINGLACSIELYFGKDVLEIDGILTPVQWKGYDERLCRYQGEILHKARLKVDFIKKLNKCQLNPETIKEVDWSGIDSIFKHIFNAFNA